jgi:hypothetical protein
MEALEMTSRCDTTLAVFSRTACIVLALLLESCVPQPASVPFLLRGEFMRLEPIPTQQKYNCNTPQGIPIVQIDETSVYPEKKIQPGTMVSFRLFYHLCSPSPEFTLKAQVTREISLSGKAILFDVQDYDLKPGTWAIGTIVTLPPAAENGEYVLTTTVSYQNPAYKNQTEKRRNVFYVEKLPSKR